MSTNYTPRLTGEFGGIIRDSGFTRNHEDSTFAVNGWICVEGLRKYFDFPQEVRAVWVGMSSRRRPESLKISLVHRGNWNAYMVTGDCQFLAKIAIDGDTNEGLGTLLLFNFANFIQNNVDAGRKYLSLFYEEVSDAA